MYYLISYCTVLDYACTLIYFLTCRLRNNSGGMAEGSLVVAICQYGGEFTSGPNGNLIYKGGEAHAVDVTREMSLDNFKDEVSKVFHVEVADVSLKYFLPNNNRTLITISCDRDLQRMVDFTASSAQVDVFLISRVENRYFLFYLFVQPFGVTFASLQNLRQSYLRSTDSSRNFAIPWLKPIVFL